MNFFLIFFLDIRSNSIFCSSNQSLKLADISYNKRLHGKIFFFLFNNNNNLTLVRFKQVQFFGRI